jgi:hypothetical protein
MTSEALEALAQIMETEAHQLFEEGAPRRRIEVRTEEAAVHP